MKKLILILLVLSAFSCREEAQFTIQPENTTIKLDLMFEHNGCKVYRFVDGSRSAEFLVEKKILLSTDLDTQWNIQLTRDTHIHSTKELVNAIEEYVKQEKQTILDFIHDEQRTCLDDGEYKAFEKVYDFIESLTIKTD